MQNHLRRHVWNSFYFTCFYWRFYFIFASRIVHRFTNAQRIKNSLSVSNFRMVFKWIQCFLFFNLQMLFSVAGFTVFIETVCWHWVSKCLRLFNCRLVWIEHYVTLFQAFIHRIESIVLLYEFIEYLNKYNEIR